MSKKASPFKFLDAYGYADNALFFGRKAEVGQLYEAITGVKHLLLYGPSGVGKTSLIECGLRNQFSDADWFAITIRRGEHLLKSFFAAINEAMENPLPIDPRTGWPKEREKAITTAVNRLFNQRFQPIYLLFDQFEELLLLGDEDEKITFFKALNELIYYKIPCKIILVMREEFIGHLSEFEQYCPTLFQHRFRLEKMGRTQVGQVIENTLLALTYEQVFAVKDAPGLAASILSRLPDNTQQIELTYVQVFLNELWERATLRSQEQKKDLLQLDRSLIKENDRLSSVLQHFLVNQLKALEQHYGSELPLEVLAALITEHHTKLLLSEAELQRDLEEKGVDTNNKLPDLLADLQERRILRSLRWGDVTRYEIGHDLLASVVGENLTDEIRMREKARSIYRFYQEREAPLAQEDIDHLRALQIYQPLPLGLQESIESTEKLLASEQVRALAEAREHAAREQGLRATAEEKARLAKLRARIAFVLLAVAGIAAFVAIWSQQIAQQQKKLALEKSYELQWENAETQKVGGQYEAGVLLLQDLKEQIDNPVHPVSRKIDSTIQDWRKIEQLTTRANTAFELADFEAALSSLQQAIDLDTDDRLEAERNRIRQDWYWAELRSIAALRPDQGQMRLIDSLLDNNILARDLATSREEVMEQIDSMNAY